MVGRVEGWKEQQRGDRRVEELRWVTVGLPHLISEVNSHSCERRAKMQEKERVRGARTVQSEKRGTERERESQAKLSTYIHESTIS